MKIQNKEYLIRGFTYGFDLNIDFQNCSPRTSCNNLLSAHQYPDVVDKKLSKELEAGRIAGPFNFKPFVDFHASPLGVVEKKTPGTYHLIHNLSSPKHKSINDSIPTEFSVFSILLSAMLLQNLKLLVDIRFVL